MNGRENQQLKGKELNILPETKDIDVYLNELYDYKLSSEELIECKNNLRRYFYWLYKNYLKYKVPIDKAIEENNLNRGILVQ